MIKTNYEQAGIGQLINDYLIANPSGHVNNDQKRLFWKLFREAYTSQEFVYTTMDMKGVEEYLLFLYSEHNLHKTMDSKENTLLDTLKADKAIHTLYRGVTGEHNLGASWTYDKDRAVWFATRLKQDNPLLTTATIKAEHIDCLWNCRNEMEVFMLPTLMKVRSKNIKTTAIK
tara:strand:+ start:43 stop:561 length:519 start_codon:yes stop_codon:yes gene_type:complete